LESEISEPKLLNKCVRCHNSNEDLITYSLRKVLGVRGAKFYKINYSICQKCQPNLEKGLKLEDNYHSRKLKTILSGIYLVVYIVALVIIFNSNLSFTAFTIVIPILIGSTFGSFFLILFIYRLHYKTNSENINKYFEIRKEGTVILKDRKTNRELDIINLLEIERKIAEAHHRKTYDFCPNCGAQIKTYTGFCNKCGKNLKI
jgi:multisubunit Na+/H+ antiporter MnhG subunit